MFMKNLKNKIADVLIHELETKTLDKITVFDIVSKLDVSRQAFYYHFYDVYAVVEWIFTQAATTILDSNSDIDSWSVGFYTIMLWLKGHDKFVINSYHSVPRDYVDKFMNKVSKPYVEKVVIAESKGTRLKEEQRAFITKFYTLSFNAVVIDWIKHGMKEDPKAIISNVATLIYGDVKKAAINFDKMNRMGRN